MPPAAEAALTNRMFPLATGEPAAPAGGVFCLEGTEEAHTTDAVSTPAITAESAGRRPAPLSRFILRWTRAGRVMFAGTVP
ncbi:hypothetical protein GCM10023075_60400 [Streptosporangium album]